MRAKVRNWGNSLALRIPRDYAQNLQLQEGSAVELELTEQGLIVRPARARPSPETLLSGVTPELVGGEEDWGEPQGAEEW